MYRSRKTGEPITLYESIDEAKELIEKMEKADRKVQAGESQVFLKWESTITGKTGHGSLVSLTQMRICLGKPNLKVGDTWINKQVKHWICPASELN